MSRLPHPLGQQCKTTFVFSNMVLINRKHTDALEVFLGCSYPETLKYTWFLDCARVCGANSGTTPKFAMFHILFLSFMHSIIKDKDDAT